MPSDTLIVSFDVYGGGKGVRNRLGLRNREGMVWRWRTIGLSRDARMTVDSIDKE